MPAEHPAYAIRPARRSDASTIVRLINLNVATGELLPRSEEFVAAHATHFLVASEDGRLLGCVHLDAYAPSLAEIRSLVVTPEAQGRGVGVALVAALERLAKARRYHTLFAVSNNEEFFRRRGYVTRHIPELDRERSAVSRFKGVYAKDLA